MAVKAKAKRKNKKLNKKNKFIIALSVVLAFARRKASGLPCGSKFNWLTFAETNNIAEPFLHAATQAPQPIQEAASIASSATGFGIRIALASCGAPVRTLT